MSAGRIGYIYLPDFYANFEDAEGARCSDDVAAELVKLKKENVKAFQEKFEQVVRSSISEEQRSPRIDVDLEMGFHDISDKFLRILKQFAPHGPENMTPVFLARSVFDTGWAQVIGNNHLINPNVPIFNMIPDNNIVP